MEDEFLELDIPLSRHSSVASINELLGEEEDKSLERAGDVIRLIDCEDKTFIANAYRYCSRCLSGSWATCPPEKFDVKYLRYIYVLRCAIWYHLYNLKNVKNIHEQMVPNCATHHI